MMLAKYVMVAGMPQELACDTEAALGLAAEGGLVGALLALVGSACDAGADAHMLSRTAAAVLATLDARELPRRLSEVRTLEPSCVVREFGPLCGVPRDSPSGTQAVGQRPGCCGHGELPRVPEVHDFAVDLLEA